MTLRTVGTSATTSLRAMLAGPYGLASNGVGAINNGRATELNMALLRSSIKDDLTNGNPIWPEAVIGRAGGVAGGGPNSSAGGGMTLYIPNRGVLQVFAGDYIAYDTTTGWPILISGNAIANGPWTHGT